MTVPDDQSTLPRPSAHRSATTVQPGDQVLHFKIIRRLGSGGMGDVFLANDHQLGRSVALKFISSSLWANSDVIKRFEREARACAAISHPNVVTVYAIHHREAEPFLVYEYVEGDNLSGIDPLTPTATRLDILRQVASGLAAIHARGVVHRDIKPTNVILSPAGVAKIVDLGLGKCFDTCR